MRLPVRSPLSAVFAIVLLSLLDARRPLAQEPAASPPAVAAPVSAPSAAAESVGFRKSLFNGVDLDGWHVSDGCEAKVENQAIVLSAGNGWMRTDHRYSDFVLELEWRPRKSSAWDSGVYIRAQSPPAGRQFPDRYQINLKQNDEGNLLGLKNGRSQGLIKAGEWNRFRLKVVGATAEMEINGWPAWKADGLQLPSGHIGLQIEVPEGGQHEFRDLHVTELGFRSLFNGRDLDGWEGANQDASLCWKVEDGLLVCTGKKGPWLRSKQEVSDFDLRLEYKVQPKGNSGVFVRVPADGNHHGPASGVEIQVLDDRGHQKLKSWQYTGSVYDIAPATQHVGREVGQWNSLEIHCQGSSYRITHNGVIIVDAREEEFPGLKERRLQGFLGLQNHSTEVWFRNLRIGPCQAP